MKRIMLMIGIVALMATFSFGTSNYTASAREHRRESGPHWMAFFKGEAIVGGTVVYDLGPGKVRAWYNCGIAVATHDGRLKYGAAGAYPQELASLPSCESTMANPGLRHSVLGLDSKPLWVRPGDRVIVKTLELGKSRRTYFNCVFLSIPRKGKLLWGDQNPYPQEIQDTDFPRCETTTPNPGHRRATGDGGTKHFEKGHLVLGAYIKLSDGREFLSTCWMVAPMDGNVTSGVIDFYPPEDDQLPRCAL